MEIREIRKNNLLLLRGKVESQAVLADMVSSTSSYVSQVLRGAIPLGSNFCRRAEKSFNLEKGWMEVDRRRPAVTLLPRVRTGHGGARITTSFDKNLSGHEATLESVGEGSFALPVCDDTMDPLIPVGSVLIVDPTLSPASGSIVVVESRNGIFVREYLSQITGEPVLRPLNGRYSLAKLSDVSKILGVVVEMQSRKSLRIAV